MGDAYSEKIGVWDLLSNKQDRDNFNSERIIRSNGVIPFKRKQNIWWVQSQSFKSKRYRVTKTAKADVWGCECVEFIKRLYKGYTEPCKHILAVQKWRLNNG